MIPRCSRVGAQRTQEDCDRDFFMTPEEAQEYGLIDEVIQVGEGRGKEGPEGGERAGARVGSGGRRCSTLPSSHSNVCREVVSWLLHNHGQSSTPSTCHHHHFHHHFHQYSRNIVVHHYGHIDLVELKETFSTC